MKSKIQKSKKPIHGATHPISNFDDIESIDSTARIEEKYNSILRKYKELKNRSDKDIHEDVKYMKSKYESIQLMEEKLNSLVQDNESMKKKLLEIDEKWSESKQNTEAKPQREKSMDRGNPGRSQVSENKAISKSPISNGSTLEEIRRVQERHDETMNSMMEKIDSMYKTYVDKQSEYNDILDKCRLQYEDREKVLKMKVKMYEEVHESNSKYMKEMMTGMVDMCKQLKLDSIQVNSKIDRIQSSLERRGGHGFEPFEVESAGYELGEGNLNLTNRVIRGSSSHFKPKEASRPHKRAKEGSRQNHQYYSNNFLPTDQEDFDKELEERLPSTSTLNHKPQFFNEKKELKAGGKRIEAGGGSISKVAGQAGIVLSSNKGSQEKKSKDYHSMINQIHMMRKEYKTLEDENNQLYSMMKSTNNL